MATLMIAQYTKTKTDALKKVYAKANLVDHLNLIEYHSKTRKKITNLIFLSI